MPFFNGTMNSYSLSRGSPSFYPLAPNPSTPSPMPLIVQKFGGTSVADSQKILAAARKAIRAQQQGNRS